MGVERSVTRWYVQRQTLVQEIALLEEKLARLSQTAEEGAHTGNVTEQPENEHDLQQQLAKTRERLHVLGPCPRPMMG